MPQFEVSEEEVNGQPVRSMLAGAGKLSSVFEKYAKETPAENGIGDPQPEEHTPSGVPVGVVAERDRCRVEGGEECVFQVSW